MKRSQNDPYWEVVVEQYDNLLFLYRRFAEKRPVMLFDIQEQRIYAYPYRDFAADLSKKSQPSLARQYRAARADGNMVVFIRDNVEQQLISYSVSIKKNRTRHANPLHATMSNPWPTGSAICCGRLCLPQPPAGMPTGVHGR